MKSAKKNRLTLHLLQFPSVYGKPLKTLHHLEKSLTGFPVKMGDWLILPEMWPSSLMKGDPTQQQAENAFCFHWLKHFAQEKKCYLAGSMLEMPQKKAYNTAFFINPGGRLLARYRKIHLFPLTDEPILYHPGQKVQVVRLPWGTMGMAICYDLRFPEMFRKMSKRGAKLIIIPSAWPRERVDHWLTLLKARAIENQCYVVGVNKCGPEKKGVVFGGHSVVFDPWGENLGELGLRKGTLSLKIDLSRVDHVRKRFPFLKSRVLS